MENTKRILISILFFLPLIINAQWHHANGPYGDIQVSNFAVNNNYLFASAYQKGIFRSPDNGSAWEEVNVGLDDLNVNCIFASGDSLYAGTNSGIYFSINNGEKWIEDNSGLADSTINAIGKLGGIIYAATNAGIYVQSVSGPVTWLSANNGIESNFTNSLLSNNDYIFAGTYKGLYRKNSNDTAWTDITNGINSEIRINSLIAMDSQIFAGTKKNGIYVSVDQGDYWAQLTLPYTNMNIYDFAVNKEKIFAVSDSGVLKSDDYGYSWEFANKGLPNNGSDLGDIISKDNRLFVSSYKADIYYSDDNGEEWIKLNSQLGYPKIIGLYSYNGTIYASSFFSGLYSLKTESSDWNWLNKDYSIIFPEFLYLDENNIYVANSSGFHSYNLNTSDWELHNEGFDDSFDYISVTSITSVGDYYYAGTDRLGFYKSHKDTLIWSEIKTPFSRNNEIMALASVDSVIYCIINYSVAKTLDFGLTFDYAAGNDLFYAQKLSVYDKDLYVYGVKGIHYIHDNNGKWIDISYNLTEEDVWFFALHNDGAFASTYDGVYWKSNADTVWEDITSGLPDFDHYYSFNGKYPLALKGDIIYVATETEGVFYADVSSFSSIVDVEELNLPQGFELKQNYPNPFNPSTNIEFTIPASGKIRLAVFDLLGREISVLVDDFLPAGSHKVEFDAKDLASGVYIYKISSGSFNSAKKLILLK